MENNEEKAPCFLSPISQFHQPPSLIKDAHEREQNVKQGKEYYLSQINEWEYCYCPDCKQIRFSPELEATEDGIRCAKCKGDKVEAPSWVVCPHHKDTIVKCPRSGKGIVRNKYGAECRDHCNFRLSED